jgi:hypothetical protein
MSDRFTRDSQQSPQRPEDRALALRVREEMRVAVSNVRAGPSAAADRPAEHESGPTGDVEPTVGRVDVHPVR